MLKNEDLKLHKALMKTIDEATFPLKAREVAPFSQCYNWLFELPKNLKLIENDLVQKYEKQIDELKKEIDSLKKPTPRGKSK